MEAWFYQKDRWNLDIRVWFALFFFFPSFLSLWSSTLLYFLFRAFVFFSSPIAKELVNHIKRDSSVLSRIGALREVIILLLWNLFLSLFYSFLLSLVPLFLLRALLRRWIWSFLLLTVRYVIIHHSKSNEICYFLHGFMCLIGECNSVKRGPFLCYCWCCEKLWIMLYMPNVLSVTFFSKKVS